jgi:multidrug efflux system membrane fusion protein
MDDQPSEIEALPSEAPASAFDFRAAPKPPPGELAPPRRRLRSVIKYLLVLALIGAVIGIVVARLRGPSQGGRRFALTGPVPVGTATVAKGDLPIILRGLGTVTPLATVTVKTQLSGYLVAVGFKEGQMVKKGDFLAQIDPRPYQVALEQAESQLGKDEAALANARLDLQRYDRLVAQNSIARQTRDTQAALVAQDEATVKADQAQIDAQKLNLTYAHIVSPVSGRVGLRQVDAGNYVTPSDPNGIVVVTQLQPISVIFTLPEGDLPAILRRLHAGASLPTTVFDSTGTEKLDSGRLETIDNQIDPTTGTFKLRAIFNNEDGILFPNQFVVAELVVNTLTGVDIVPTSAIERGAPGTFVYLVKPDHTASVQPVTLGPTDGLRQAVTKGLRPGEIVVTDGADRLKEGAKVTIVPAGAAGPAGAPPPGKASRRPRREARSSQGPAALTPPSPKRRE